MRGLRSAICFNRLGGAGYVVWALAGLAVLAVDRVVLNSVSPRLVAALRLAGNVPFEDQMRQCDPQWRELLAPASRPAGGIAAEHADK